MMVFGYDQFVTSRAVTYFVIDCRRMPVAHLAEALQYRDKDLLWIRLKYRDILSSIFFIQIAARLYPGIQSTPD